MKVEETKNVRRKEKRKKRLRSSPSLRSRFGLLSNLANESQRMSRRKESIKEEMEKGMSH